MRVLLLITLTTCLFVLPAYAKYSGGTGEPNDPYQIATAADLIALGETPEDYDKHFILTADIDLDPNLPGRKVFDKAVIAPDTNDAPSSWFEGTAFASVFDGNGHTISHLTIIGGSFVGLFGRVEFGAEVKNVRVVDVNITGTGSYVGGLIGWNNGSVTDCRSTGAVSGADYVGGLIGYNEGSSVTDCRSSGAVSGADCIGGLVGFNDGSISACYSSASVSGEDVVGGLAGGNGGMYGGGMARCCSTGSVSGKNHVGGLVGSNSEGSIVMSYSTGSVTGEYTVGGLVGDNSGYGSIVMSYSVSSVSGYDVAGLANVDGMWGGPVDSSFWDIETSGCTGSVGGTGKTTAEMMDPNTFMAAGWDFVGQPDGPHDIWAQPEGGGYPILSWQLPAGFGLPDFSGGTGEANDPYLIATGEELNSIGHNPRLMACHFVLANDLDLVGLGFYPIGSSDFPYVGVFDGKGHTISHLTGSNGLFGHLGGGAHVRNVGVVDVSIVGGGGGLVGTNGGQVTNCYSSGSVNGGYAGGGLVGWNNGSIAACYSSASVSGDSYAGGLVGKNEGSIIACYSSGLVSGTDRVGGLVGWNYGSIAVCYSSGLVSGTDGVGGLVGWNYGSIAACYSSGSVSGTDRVAGLVGENHGSIAACYSIGSVSGTGSGGLVGEGSGASVRSSFWDIQTSGRMSSAGGAGLTTTEMMDPYMLGLNGFASDPNWVLDAGRDYPRLSWEGTPGQIIPPPPEIDWIQGSGTPDEPYRLETAEQLILLSKACVLWDKHFALKTDIDLNWKLPGRELFGHAVIGNFSGVFDGNGHTISHLTIVGDMHLGLFGTLNWGAKVRNLGIVDVNITGSGNYIGGLAGRNAAGIDACYSSGSVSGTDRVGGLVGYNSGDITASYNNGSVSGNEYAGGLVGYNDYGDITAGCNNGSVSGNRYVGGLLGQNYEGNLTRCYSTGSVTGSGWGVGGLVGDNHGDVVHCFSVGAITGGRSTGGLVGSNSGDVVQCYSTGAVSGGAGSYVGGLVGYHYYESAVTYCYSTGAVRGDLSVGGLVGYQEVWIWNGRHGITTASFWDTETSGQTASASGTGKTTVEMQAAATFLEAGWDFVGETANGTEDIWWIVEGKDYPRLWWELGDEASP